MNASETSNTAFCFDLDGTLTTTEILPCIAAELDVSGEVATLTRLTMDGLIPFEDSMRLRTLILGQVPLAQVHQIIASIPMAPSLLSFVQSRPNNCFVVTGNLDIWIAPLIAQLRCDVFSSHAVLTDAGMVRLDTILAKDEAIQTLRATGRFDRIVAVGDGANDAPMLRAAEIGIAYGGVHPPAISAMQAANMIINDAETLCKLLKAL